MKMLVTKWYEIFFVRCGQLLCDMLLPAVSTHSKVLTNKLKIKMWTKEKKLQ